MRDLTEAMNLVAESQKDSREKKLAFNKALPAPDLFVQDGEDMPAWMGFGYWKTPEGVVRYRKYGTGYDPGSKEFFSNEMIEKLALIVSTGSAKTW